MKKYPFVLSLAFVLIPAGFALADTIKVSAPGLQDSLFGVTEAINAQTRTIQSAVTQQQLAVLDQDCVSQVVAKVREGDLTGSIKTQKIIDDYITDHADDQMNNEERISYTNYLNYSSTILAAGKSVLNNVLIKYCQKQPASQVQSSQSTSCKQGLTLNKSKQCVTNMQACKDDYGSGSEWSGHLDANGGSVCGCLPGYDWNNQTINGITYEPTACVSQSPAAFGSAGSGVGSGSADKKIAVKEPAIESRAAAQAATASHTDEHTPQVQEIASSTLEVKSPVHTPSIVSRLWSWLWRLIKS